MVHHRKKSHKRGVSKKTPHRIVCKRGIKKPKSGIWVKAHFLNTAWYCRLRKAGHVGKKHHGGGAKHVFAGGIGGANLFG